MEHYLTELDLSPEQTRALLDEAEILKEERTRNVRRDTLAGRTVALYFEKPSVRTRVSFTIGVRELGGEVVELSPANTKVGKGEHPEDFAKVLGRYVHAIVARVFDQATLESLAEHSGVPTINALSDALHPCQALADALTIRERKGRLEGLRFAFIGEGNNVAASTGLLLAALGMQVVIASPAGYGLPPSQFERARGLAGTLECVEGVQEAVEGADVVYTDTWVSMGQELEAEARRSAFVGFKVDEALLESAPDAIVMHCLPAVRGEEIDTDVMYGERSAIWDQAENRLHVQKALMLRLLGSSR